VELVGLGLQLLVRKGSRILFAEGRLRRTCIKMLYMGKRLYYINISSRRCACSTAVVFTGIFTVSV